MKTPKIQWLEWEELQDEPHVAHSLEGRFYIHGFRDLGYTLEIREIRYGLKDQPNTVRVITLNFASMRKAKKFAQRRIEHISKGEFNQADLAVADLQEGALAS
jgi:hypothetical protein